MIKRRSRVTFCNRCNDLVEFETFDQEIKENFKGELISYIFEAGKCKKCGCEVITDSNYNSRKTKAKMDAYKAKTGIALLA